MTRRGHRRWQAAQQLAMDTVPVERRSFASDEDELEALLLENENRDKTTEQKVREAACWLEIEAEKARKRQLETLKQNQVSVPANLRERNEQGESSEKAAAKVGMKARSYEKAAQVVRTADTLTAQGKTTEAQTLLRVLNEQSVDAAAKIVREDEPVRDAALQKIATGEVSNIKEAKRAIQVEQYAVLAAQLKQQKWIARLRSAVTYVTVSPLNRRYSVDCLVCVSAYYEYSEIRCRR